MIRVTQTIRATTSDGTPFLMAPPKEMPWYTGDDLLAAASAVVNILSQSRDQKFVMTTDIHIDLLWEGGEKDV